MPALCASSTHHVRDSIQTGDPLYLCVGDTGCTEYGGSKDGHAGNTDPLLHDLEPDNQLNTTASVEFAGADTEKHRNVGLSLRGLTFELSDVANILEFGLSLAHVCTRLATESSKDVTGLFLSANFDEPAR